MDTTNETSLPLPRPGRLKLLVHGFMLIVFTITSVAPSAHAFAGGPGIFNGLDQVSGGSGGGDEHEERYARFFERARAEVAAVAGKPDKYGRLPAADRQEAARENLGELLDELGDIESAIEDEFDQVGKLVRSKKLPKSIRARHDAAFSSVTGEFEAVRRDIRQVRNERDPKKRKSLAEGLYRRFDAQRFERSQQEFDPAELPNSTLKPDENNTPRLTEDDYIASGLVGNPIYRVAQAGGYNIANLPGASDPAYLAATDEVVLTDDIRAKATELGNEPVRIYEWVRNNVQWAPTWGAIQDASHTLSSRRGNAFDISSLTIALLRAAGYPARYVHGTLDVPEAAFRNWAGGFENINAAMEFASAGGIPLGPVTSAGRITKVRMEHIWVEAAIDFHPSRGTRNREADTWVAMDPGFKQIEIVSGIDAVQASGIDPNAIANAFAASGTLNTAEGWGSGFDASLLNAQLRGAHASIESYVDQNASIDSVAEALGGRRIVLVPVTVLPTGLSNRVVVTGARYARLPASLQQQITFAFGKDITGEPVNPRTFAWALLNNRKLTVSFRPATADDHAALSSLLPQGDIENISDIPTNIPAYLVNVVPELKLEGNIVMSGPSMSLGSELTFVFNPKFAGRGTKPFSYKLAAGAYLALANFAGDISKLAMDRSKAELQAQKAIFSDPTQSGYDGITRERVLGDLYHAATLSYYSQYSLFIKASQARPRAFHELAAGIGSIGYEPLVSYFFGVPRSMRTGGVTLNIPIVNIVGADSSDPFAKRDASLRNGLLSSTLEHMVADELGWDGVGERRSVSAVRAIELARQAGSRVYQVDGANLESALAASSLDAGAIAEVRNTVGRGHVAIIHSTPVTAGKWRGSGYVLYDPVTGEGAYKISGGANGSFTDIATDPASVISIFAAGVGGFVDGALAQYFKQSIFFADELKHMTKLDKLWSKIGYIGLILALSVIVFSPGLSWDEKLKGASVEVLAFAVMSKVITALLAATGPAGLLLAILVSVVLTYAFLWLMEFLTNFELIIEPRARRRDRERQPVRGDPVWA
jgi:transglutaminase-like putative cysteine protease